MWGGCVKRSSLGFAVTPLVFLVVAVARSGRGGDVDERGDVINAVRCRVRCLSLMQRVLDPELSHVYESVTLLTCLQEPECEACLRPCNQPFTSVNGCQDACQLPPPVDQPCRQSCQFVRRVNAIRPGECPDVAAETGRGGRTDGRGLPPDGAPCTAEANAAEAGCQTDADCVEKTQFKCCPSLAMGCGWSCQQPSLRRRFPHETPEIPDRPVIRERPKSPSIELRWNSVTSNSTFGPVLYIVDSRWNIGPKEIESDMTAWQQVAQTTSTSTMVSDVTPGHWYQFRVTAVNINGRRGSSLPTKAFTLSREPRRPGPPTNVTEGDTLIMGGKVAVNLHWLHPKKSDLPISRYKLSWSKKAKSGGTQSSTDVRQMIAGDQLMFQIPDLEPDTIYSVQIQAICQYGEARLKSDRVSLAIVTYPLPRTNNQGVGLRTQQPVNTVRSVPTPATPLQLVAHQAFFQNGVLKANVTWTLPSREDGRPEVDRVFIYWSPEACIADHLPDDGLAKVVSGSTQETYFVIYNLRFDCRYLVRVQSVTNQGVLGVTSHLTLATPACYEAPVVGKIRPDCPNVAARLPDEPSNLHHSFFISQSNITARLSWDGPSPDGARPRISGYRVIWGLMPPQTHGSFADASATLTKVLPGEMRSFSLSGLQEGTTYAVRIQALARAGAGRAVSLHFTTPLLQLDQLDRPDSEQDEEQRGHEEEEEEDAEEDDVIDYDVRSDSDSATETGRQASSHQVAPGVRSSAAAAAAASQSSLYLEMLILLHLVIQGFVASSSTCDSRFSHSQQQ